MYAIPSTSLPVRARPAALAPLALLAGVALLIWPQGAAAAPRCHGKRATIVSNAARIVGTKGPNVIVAGAGDNVIYGEGGNDTICGGGGDDQIHGGRGKDSLFGQGGEDSLYGERGSDSLDGGAGADSLFGESGNDELNGGGGAGDRVYGGPGDDRLLGGAGDYDVLAGGPGHDRIDGGPGGHDIVSYAGTGAPLRIDLAAQQVRGAESERLRGIEDAVGGSGADTLIGAPGTANRLDGGPGGDRLLAAGPGDEALGGPGSDDCAGAFAAEASCGPSGGTAGTAVELYDSIDGQSSLIVTGTEGMDAVSISSGGGSYTVQGEPGAAPVVPGDPSSASCAADAGGDAVSCRGQVNSILASLGGGDDRLTVAESVLGSVSSTIEGGGGSDTLRGGRGDDVIYAGDDHLPDTLEGGGGNDVLYGVDILHPRKDSGAAKMLGGPGIDLMVGGQPCDGDLFAGGPGPNDSASFARVRNSGIFVRAVIGGTVTDPNVHHCEAGHIARSTDKIEGSPGPDILIGDGVSNVLLGRGGNDRLIGRGGHNTCIGGGGHDRATRCSSRASVP